MKPFRRPIIALLIWYARNLSRKRDKYKNSDYVQTWNLMPRRWIECKNEFYPNGQRKLKRAKFRLFLEWLCEIFIGHELSETERGYSGGGHIDHSCRWCDKTIPIPIEESPSAHHLVSMFDELKEAEA